MMQQTPSGCQPDLTWQHELMHSCKGQWLGGQVRAYVTCPSTQPIAWQWVQQHAPHGSVVVASEQTAGRGRLQRGWWTGEGGLAMSIVLRPQNLLRVQSLGLVVAVGLLDVLQRHGLVGKIKWPNDVLLPIPSSCLCVAVTQNHGKWAGILPQSAWSGTQLQAVVLGIGMNVQRPCLQLPNMAQRAIFLSDCGVAITPQLFAVDVLQALQQVLQQACDAAGWQQLQARAKQHCITLGQQVCVRQGDRVWQGRAVDITATGALLLQLPNATRQQIDAGEATVVAHSR